MKGPSCAHAAPISFVRFHANHAYAEAFITPETPDERRFRYRRDRHHDSDAYCNAEHRQERAQFLVYERTKNQRAIDHLANRPSSMRIT